MNKAFASIALSLMLLSSLFTGKAQGHLDIPDVPLAETHPTLLQISGEILRHYPPSEFLYLGIGRSPYLLMEYLAFLGGDARHLPLSQFSEAQFEGPIIRRFTDYYLGHTQTSKKNILYIDYANNGSTLINMARFGFTAELDRGDKAKKLHIFSIHTWTPKDFFIARIQDKVARAHLASFRTRQLDLLNPYARALDVAQYDKWAPHKETPFPELPIEPNPNHKAAREKILDFLHRSMGSNSCLRLFIK